MSDNVIPADELERRRKERLRELVKNMGDDNSVYLLIGNYVFDEKGDIAGDGAYPDDSTLMSAVSDLMGRVHQLEQALRQIIACERLLGSGSVTMDIALTALGDDDE